MHQRLNKFSLPRPHSDAEAGVLPTPCQWSLTHLILWHSLFKLIKNKAIKTGYQEELHSDSSKVSYLLKLESVLNDHIALFYNKGQCFVKMYVETREFTKLSLWQLISIGQTSKN